MCGLAVKYDLSEFDRLCGVTAKAFIEAESGQSLGEYYIKCGEALEIAGVPKREICAMVREGVEQKLRAFYKDENIVFHPGYFYRVMDGHGWKRPWGANRTGTSAGDDDNYDDDDEDVKSPKGHSDTSDSLNSFLLLDRRVDANGVVDPAQIPQYKYRWPFFAIYKRNRDILDKMMEELSRDYEIETTETGKTVRRPRDFSKLVESDADMMEFVTALHDLLTKIDNIAEKALDNRQSILPTMLFVFVAKLSITTIKHFASKHFAHIRALEDITTKKTTQFVKSVDSKSDILLATMADAWKWYYIDLKCRECKTETLEMKALDDGTWHFVCRNWKAHGVDEIEFPAELFKVKINSLELNHGRAAENYVKRRGLPDD